MIKNRLYVFFNGREIYQLKNVTPGMIRDNKKYWKTELSEYGKLSFKVETY